MCRADLARMRGDVDGRAGVRPCRARPRHRAGRAARRGRALPGGVRRLARGPGGGRRARARRASSPSGSRPRSTTSCRAPRSTSAPSSWPGGSSARRCAPTSRGCGSRSGDRPSPSAGMSHVGLAEVHFERDELADAHRQVADGHRAVPQARVPPRPDRGPDRRSRGSGTPRATRRARSPPSTRPTGRCPRPCSTRASRWPRCARYLAVAHGDLAEAARWVRTAGLSVDDEPVYLREPEYRVLARVLIAEQDPAAGARGAGALAGARGRPGTHRERAAAAGAGGAGAPRRGRSHRGAAGPRRGARARRAGGLRARVPRRGRGGRGRCCASWWRAVASNSWACGRSPASSSSGLIEAFDRHGARASPPARAGPVARAWPHRCPPASTRCSR